MARRGNGKAELIGMRSQLFAEKNRWFLKETLSQNHRIARVSRPAHTLYDGDIVFALSYGEKRTDVNVVGELAAELVEKSILMAAKN